MPIRAASAGGSGTVASTAPNLRIGRAPGMCFTTVRAPGRPRAAEYAPALLVHRALGSVEQNCRCRRSASCGRWMPQIRGALGHCRANWLANLRNGGWGRRRIAQPAGRDRTLQVGRPGWLGALFFPFSLISKNLSSAAVSGTGFEGLRWWTSSAGHAASVCHYRRRLLECAESVARGRPVSAWWTGASCQPLTPPAAGTSSTLMQATGHVRRTRCLSR